MSTSIRSTPESARPHYDGASRVAKATIALVAVLVSCTLLGGLLGLFEMHAEDAAFARAVEPVRVVTLLADAQGR